MDSANLFAPGRAPPSFSVFEPPRPVSVAAPGIRVFPHHENLFVKHRLAKKIMNSTQRIAMTGKIHHHPAIGGLHQNHISSHLLIYNL
jgi:hypothetical protein